MKFNLMQWSDDTCGVEAVCDHMLSGFYCTCVVIFLTLATDSNTLLSTSVSNTTALTADYRVTSQLGLLADRFAGFYLTLMRCESYKIRT